MNYSKSCEYRCIAFDNIDSSYYRRLCMDQFLLSAYPTGSCRGFVNKANMGDKAYFYYVFLMLAAFCLTCLDFGMDS